MIYESVARHVGLHQLSFIGSARPVANPHKDDLDDLTESVGQAGVQGEDRDDTQVVNQVINQDNEQVNEQVNKQVDDQVDYQRDDQSDDQVKDMAQHQTQTDSDNGLTSIALPSHTFRSRVQQHTPEVGQPNTRKGRDKDETEDMVTF